MYPMNVYGSGQTFNLAVGIGGNIMNINNRHKIYLSALAGLSKIKASFPTVVPYYDDKNDIYMEFVRNEYTDEVITNLSASIGYDYFITDKMSIGAQYRFSYLDYMRSHSFNCKFSLFFE